MTGSCACFAHSREEALLSMFAPKVDAVVIAPNAIRRAARWSILRKGQEGRRA